MKIKDAAIGGRLFPSSDDDAGIAGRSLAWKVCRPTSWDMSIAQILGAVSIGR